MVTENAAAAMGLHLGSQVPVAISTGTGFECARAESRSRSSASDCSTARLCRTRSPSSRLTSSPHRLSPGRSAPVSSSTWVCSCVVERPTSPPLNGVGIRVSSTSPTSRWRPRSRRRHSSRYDPKPLRSGSSAVSPRWPPCCSRCRSSPAVLGARAHDLVVMRAVGADPATTELDGLIGIVASAVAGSVLAVGVAFALSPLFPIGPVRPVYPDPGPQADWTVLGLGCAVLVGALVMVTVIITVRDAPHRALRRSRLSGHRSSTVQVAARSGLPPSAVAGASLAVDARNGRPSGPYRWSLLSAVIAMLVVTTTLDLRRQSAHAGVPAGPVRMELGRCGAEFGRIRARSEQGGGRRAPRLRRPVILRCLVRDDAARRRRSADIARRSRIPGRSAHRRRATGWRRHARSCSGRPPWPNSTSTSATPSTSSTCPAIRAGRSG